MDEKDKIPDIVPDKLTSPINYKIIIGIAIGVVVFQFAINEIEDLAMSPYLVSMGIPVVVAILSFMSSKKYYGSIIYGKSYLILGLGFMSMFFAEVAYFIYEEILDIAPYPSIADIFFYLFYVISIFYLIKHITYFSIKIKKIDWFLICLIPIGITSSFFMFSLSVVETMDDIFYYGVLFVAITSLALGLVVYGVRIFQKGVIGNSWILLMCGFLLFTIGDTWYYYIELLGEYDVKHPVNLLWYGGYLIMFYSLYHHRKTI